MLRKWVFALLFLMYGYLNAQNLTWSNWSNRLGVLSLKSDQLLFYPNQSNNFPGYNGSRMVSYADSVTGDIKIFATAKTIYNKDGWPIQNGDFLTSCDDDVCVVPFPSGENKLYVFHAFVVTTSSMGLQTRCGVLGQITGNNTSRAFYSVVDLDANGGEGAVTQKNVPLTSIGAADFLLVKHANGKDVWLLINGGNIIILIDKDGLHEQPRQYFNSYILKDASPQGDKILCFVRGTQEFSIKNELAVVNFNNATGQLGQTTIVGLPHMPTNVLFSTDGSKIYTTSYEYRNCESQYFLYQQSIEGNEITAPWLINDEYITGMTRAIDNRIYLYGRGTELDGFGNFKRGLHVINFPNQPKAACLFEKRKYQTEYVFDFPMIMNDYVKEEKAIQLPQLSLPEKFTLCNKPVVVEAPAGYDRYVWSNGMEGRKISVSQAGQLSVLAYKNGSALAAFGVTSIELTDNNTINLPADTSVCLNAGFRLSVSNNFKEVRWSDGTTGNDYIVNTNEPYNKTIHVWATNADGCYTSDTICVTVVEPPKIELGNDTTLCKGQKLALIPDIMAYFTPPGFYKWSVPSYNNFIDVTESGTYWCRAEKNGCVNSDTIRVTFLDKAAIFLGNDTALCIGDSVIIKPATYKGTMLWNGEPGANEIMVKQTSTIIAGLPMPGCNLTDTIAVVFKPIPTINLPLDTVYCKGKGVILDPKLPGARVLWNNMWYLPNLYVNYPTNLSVQVWQEGCYAEKNIHITELPLPAIDIGDDRLVCDSLSTLLKANSSTALSYLWNNGQTTRELLVYNTGNYIVNVKDINGCENADTVTITFNNTPKVNLGKDSSICEGDTWELKHSQAGNFNYLWHNTSSASSYTVKTPGLYFVRVSNNCGIASDTIQVSKGICSLQMPTAFTPNNDGLNDFFRLKNHQFVREFYMVIFNRQQEKVFESRDVTVGWNGLYKGKLANPETYIWYISLTDKQGLKQTHSGQVVLLRNK